MKRKSPSITERLFGPIDRRLTGPDKEGLYTAAVTPPPILRLPTAFVKLTDDQAARYINWLVSGDPIQEVLWDLSPRDRETLLNGSNDFTESLGDVSGSQSQSTHGGHS